MKHNFQVGKGFEESFACNVMISIPDENGKTETTGWIQEVSPSDFCELFTANWMADMDGLINRGDAIFAVTERIKQIGYDNDPLVLSIRQAIVDLPSAQQWIPTSEKLPKPNVVVGNVTKYYLVQDEWGDMMVASYNQAPLSDTSSGARYWEQMNSFHAIKDKIVAWMELPKPLAYWYERCDGNED